MPEHIDSEFKILVENDITITSTILSGAGVDTLAELRDGNLIYIKWTI